MALLNTFPNEVQKTQDVQNQQTYIAFQQIQTWSGLILTNQDIDYKQTNTTNNALASNLTTTSQNYTNIQNLTFSFTPKNPLALVNFSLTLQGVGTIALLINGQVLEEIPFNFAVSNQLNFNAVEKFSISQNKLGLAWKATSGTVTLACSRATPCSNRFQVIDINS